MKKSIQVLFSIIVIGAFILSACAPKRHRSPVLPPPAEACSSVEPAATADSRCSRGSGCNP